MNLFRAQAIRWNAFQLARKGRFRSLSKDGKLSAKGRVCNGHLTAGNSSVGCAQKMANKGALLLEASWGHEEDRVLPCLEIQVEAIKNRASLPIDLPWVFIKRRQSPEDRIIPQQPQLHPHVPPSQKIIGKAIPRRQQTHIRAQLHTVQQWWAQTDVIFCLQALLSHRHVLGAIRAQAIKLVLSAQLFCVDIAENHLRE
jgi:hypothetical protein